MIAENTRGKVARGYNERMFEGIFRPMHLLVILVIVLIIWGPSKLAGLGKGLGEGIRNFKKSVNEGEDEANLLPSILRRRPIWRRSSLLCRSWRGSDDGCCGAWTR